MRTRSGVPRPAHDACGARVAAGRAPIQRLPHVRRVTGGAWSSVYNSATVPEAPGGSGSGSWRRKTCARSGARGLRREWPTLAQGPVTRGYPARLGAGGTARAGAPSTCVVSRWQTRVERGDLRRPISCPVLPGYTRAYGVTGPGSVICGAGGCVSERWFACRAARERARCGECWGDRRGAAVHPLLPLRTRRLPKERTGRA